MFLMTGRRWAWSRSATHRFGVGSFRKSNHRFLEALLSSFGREVRADQLLEAVAVHGRCAVLDFGGGAPEVSGDLGECEAVLACLVNEL